MFQLPFSPTFAMQWSKRRSRVIARKISRNPNIFRARFFIRRYWKLVVGLFILGAAASSTVFLRDIPSPTKLRDQLSFSVSTKMYDRNGTLLYEIYDDKKRTPIKLADLPPYVSLASIAIEDQHFYSHFGFDIFGVLRAIRNTIFHQNLQGGSTITQQLVKTTLLTRERTLQRKFREAVLTIGTEIIYSKKEILEMYLNYAPYGGTTWGIEAAAQTYFNKSAKDLTLAEAALLAGLPQSPTRYSPFGPNTELTKNRQKEVLRRMAEEKYITPTEAEVAAAQPLVFASPKSDIQAPHFVMYVRDLLVEKYGEAAVSRSGLRVTTSVDLPTQLMAEASVSAELKKLSRYNIGNGAALITKPSTGEILAMVGSKNFFDTANDGQVNITLRSRQPGSSIKPINVLTALQMKTITPATVLLDIPTCFQVPGQKPYCPTNYDGGFHGPVQTRFFLGNSYNIPEVKLLAMSGLETFIATASATGITTWKDPSNYGLSLSLGGGEVRMVDMAQAFGVIDNQGVRVPLHPILKVEDFAGKVLYEYKPEEAEQQLQAMFKDTNLNRFAPNTPEFQDPTQFGRIMDRQPTYLLADIMSDPNARVNAFGPNSQLVIPKQVVSVKTGTTNDLKDNWTIGFTPSILTAVWVGNNDNTPMNRSLVSGVTGAAPIWNAIMRELLKGKPAQPPQKPDNIVTKPVCTFTGMQPTDNCPTRDEMFWAGTEPTSSVPVGTEVWINPNTGLPPKPEESQDGLLPEKRIFLSDPFTKNYCVDCNRPVDDKGKTVYEQFNVPITPGRPQF